jgi:hypothetical protein
MPWETWENPHRDFFESFSQIDEALALLEAGLPL